MSADETKPKPIKLETHDETRPFPGIMDVSFKSSDDEGNTSDQSYRPSGSEEKPTVVTEQVICEVFKSKKGGLKLYIDGYGFYKNKCNDDVYYWYCDKHCSKQNRCNSTMITIINEDGQHILDKKPKKHNHKPDLQKKKIAEFRDKVKEIAGDTSEDLRPQDILKTAKCSMSELPDNLPSTASLRQMIYRQKCKQIVKIEEPTDIFFEPNIAEMRIDNANFVIKDRVYDENKRIMLMCTLDLMYFLGKADYWILDSISLVSETPLFAYLHTIHGNVLCENIKTFPLLFCLSTQKDQRCFDEMFGLITEYGSENNIRISPKICVIDFDMDAMLSLHSNFQDLLVHGCSFHLRRIIFRKVQAFNFDKKLATDVNFNLEIKCLSALSNLIEEDVPCYFEKLKENLQDADSTFMADWFGEEFIFGKGSPPQFPPQFWCHKPYSNIPRVQDSAEAWYHQIKMLVDKQRPGFYALTKELIKETLVHMRDIQKVISQVRPPSPPQKRPRRKKKKKPIGHDGRVDKILEKKNELPEIDVLKSIAKLLRL